MASIIQIENQQVLSKEELPTFHVKVEEVTNEHKAQVYLDYGDTPGPWVKLGFNSTEYGLGYLPTDNKVSPPGDDQLKQTT